MNRTKITTYELLISHFGGRTLVPIEEIHRDFYPKIKLRTLKNYFNKGLLSFEPIKFPNGPMRIVWLINVADFAAHIDRFI